MSEILTKTCSRCKLDLPTDNFYKDKGRLRADCKGCYSIARKARDDKRRPEKNAKQRAYYAANAERCRQWQRDYRRDNPEFVREYNRNRYRKNSAVFKARVMQYIKDNPEVRRTVMRKRRARILESNIAPFTTAQLTERMAYFGFKCWMCGGPYESADHVKPLSKGGSHMLANLRPACRSCNSSKSAKWPFTLEDATWLCP